MRIKTGVPFLLLLASSLALSQQNPLVESLLKNRYSLSIQEGRFTGPGAEPLGDLVADAQFVMVGEDHATAEVPQFVGTLCDVLGPQGFRGMAVESGSIAIEQILPWVGQADRRSRVAALEKQYPDSLAFFDMQPENELLSHCAGAFPGNGKFLLWGLDQEFMGASGLILSRIQATHPGKNAAAAIQDAVQKEAQFRAKAASTGNPEDLYMMSASEEEVNRIRDLLNSEGSAGAQSLWAQFLESREIYHENMTRQGYDSNRRRALWMKTSFQRDYEQATKSEGKPPKMLLKFGDWHLYKGMNPLHNNDLGNFLAELADGHRQKAANIIILGVKGKHLRFAGIGRPYQVEDFKMLDDPDYKFMAPMTENLSPDGWTVFDLRGLRKSFRSLGPVDVSMERLIFGYDLLVLVPQVTASEQIQ